MALSLPLQARPRRAVQSRSVAVRLALVALVVAVLLGGEKPRALRIRQEVGPHAFVLLDWEAGQLSERISRIGAGLLGRRPPVDDGARSAAAAYFQAAPANREPLRAQAEAAIERGLTTLLTAEGLDVNLPLSDNAVVFPPVSFSFVSPPQVLIVSRRDRIGVDQSELLRPDLSARDVEALEARADRQGVSSLVVPIGGLATYPSMVLEGSRPLDALVGVAHEWIHSYLFLRPLGRAYWDDQAARTINESATDIASRELGERLLSDLGLAEPARSAVAQPSGQATPSRRDVRTILRTTRVAVDAMLAERRIAEAEAYMAERRAELAAAGYDVRKLNQAYFAFYGSYGDAAAGASPITSRLQRLRAGSSSVGDFLTRVARLTTGDDLARAVGDA